VDIMRKTFIKRISGKIKGKPRYRELQTEHFDYLRVVLELAQYVNFIIFIKESTGGI
jgi:uncharacterized membrane protein (DUF485 family)